MSDLLRRLFTSPADKGFFDSSAFFGLLSAGLGGKGLHGLASGVVDMGRNGSVELVSRTQSPGLFAFAILTLLILGAAAGWWALKRWRGHDA